MNNRFSEKAYSELTGNEKEVYLAILENEKKVMTALEAMYEDALEAIQEKIKALKADELTQSRIYRLQYQEELEDQIEAILIVLQGNEYETIQDFLKDTYTDSMIGVMYAIFGQGIPIAIPIDQKKVIKAILNDSKISEGLYKHLGVDIEKLKKTITQEISRGIASNMALSDIFRNISNRAGISKGRAMTITRTEAHRIQEAAAQDARAAAVKAGAEVVKQWDAIMDGKTRKTHRKLDGQIREVDEYFEVDGKKALYPGGFGTPEEDINCRCIALTRAKWALDEEELERLKERAKFFELDKTDEFEEFKRKYLKNVKD